MINKPIVGVAAAVVVIAAGTWFYLHNRHPLPKRARGGARRRLRQAGGQTCHPASICLRAKGEPGAEGPGTPRLPTATRR